MNILEVDPDYDCADTDSRFEDMPKVFQDLSKELFEKAKKKPEEMNEVSEKKPEDQGGQYKTEK